MLHSETFYAFLTTAVSLTIVATLLSRLQIPTIVGFVLTGLFIGPSGIGLITSLPAAQTISELGIVFLMFSLGLEVSLEHLKRMLRPLMTLGFSQVTLTSAVGFLFFFVVLDFSWPKSFVLAACLSLSSTAIVLKLLQEKRETETPYGRISIIVLLFQDIVALPLMASIPLLANLHATTSQAHTSLVFSTFLVMLFLISCVLVGRYVIPRLFNEIALTHSREVFFFSILSLTFIVAFLAEKVGLSMSLGAFIAGVLISESPYNKQALAELSPFRDIFLGFFFASLGMMVDIPFILAHWSVLVWLIPILFIIKFGVLFAITRVASQSHGVSLTSSLSLAQIGEFSFILAASALAANLIQTEEFQYFLAVSISSLIFTPLLFNVALKSSAHTTWRDLTDMLNPLSAHPLKYSGQPPSLSEPLAIKGNTPFLEDLASAARRTIVIGVGHAGQRILDELTLNGIPCIGIDLNYENIKAINERGIDGIFGDSTSPDVLVSAGIESAHLVIVTVSGKHVTPKVVAVIKSLNPNVNILVRAHYLLELQDFKNLHRSQIVVSEIETANTLVHKALACYGLADTPQV